ncbi:MAG: hypothetical protein D6803_05130 [Anaerolineae bacterium]|nr:MAG: hypothetical protein D6803_05130 [Anaerolineae bacterium]
MSRRNIIPIILIGILIVITIAALAYFGYLIYRNVSQPAEGITISPFPPQISPTPEFTPTPYAFAGGPPNTIRLMWFSKPPLDGDLQTIAENFDLIILTQNDENALAELRRLGYTDGVPQYFRLDAIKDPGNCTEDPPGNQAAYYAGDFCQISQNHPDWFLLDYRGERIYDGGSGSGYVFMDPGNPEWRQFFLQRVKESQERHGYYGVFLDNVDASLARYERKASRLKDYANDAQFQAAVEGFLQFLYQNYFQPQGRPLLANIVANRNFEPWFRYLEYLDGAMDEGWGVGWTDEYYSAAEWDEQLARAESTQGRGKFALLVSSGRRNDLARQQFAFASYLLINHGRAFFRYAHSDSYREIWLYSNYYLDLGTPLGVRYRDGDVWRRDFSKGSVIVNPFTHEVEFIVP